MTDCIDHGQLVGKFTYGKKTLKGKSLGLHVWTYCTHHGLDTFSLKGTGQVIRHSCDNKRCINPAHLSLGSRSDNVRDAMRSNLVYKLSYEKAERMRELHQKGVSRRELESMFNVSKATVQRVVVGDTWNE